MAVAFERALGAPLHPPPLVAADDEDSHAEIDSRRSPFIANRPFPESRVLCHDTRRREAGEDESASPIAKTALEEIHRGEASRGFEKYRCRARTPSLGKVLIRPPPAVAIELLKILIQRRVGVMQQRLFDFANFALGYIDVLVDKIGIVAQLTLEQSDRFVAASTPAAVAYLFAEEVIPSRDAKG